KERHDEAMYEDLRRHRTVRAAQDYLQTAPLQTMRKEVSAYQEYLLNQEREIPLTLHLSRIEWNNCWGGKTDYTVSLDGRTVMEGSMKAVKSAVSKDVAEASIKCRLEEGVKLQVRARHTGTFTDTDYHNGKSSWEGKACDLNKGSVDTDHP